MILVTKVLMLQLALILGKLLYGLKDLFAGKHQHPQPVYHVSPPVTYYHEPSYIPYGPTYSSSHGSSSYGSSSYGSHDTSRDDGLPPQFNHPINQLPSFHQPQQNFQPQAKYGQPQISPFSRIALEAPQQIQYSPQLFSQPYSRLQTLDQRILSENLIDDNSQLIQAPKTSLSPQELTQVLSDAIAQVSAKSSRILQAIQKR